MVFGAEEFFRKAKWLHLDRLFFRDPDDLTGWKVIKWWEIRRLAFNACVGITGLITLVIMTTTGCLMEANGHDAVGISDPPLFEIIGIVLYALLANVCYTGGWIVELILRLIWPRRVSAFGKVSFVVGLAGSALLTLLPAGLTVIVAMCEVIAKTPRTP